MGSSTPNATKFFFRGFSQHLSSRSPREGVDTCRDRALNASGRGYYGQAERVGRAPPVGVWVGVWFSSRGPLYHPFGKGPGYNLVP